MQISENIQLIILAPGGIFLGMSMFWTSFNFDSLWNQILLCLSKQTNKNVCIFTYVIYHFSLLSMSESFSCAHLCSFHAYFCVDTLRWRHNGRDSVSNHQPHHCLLSRLFRRRSKKTSKLCVTGLCVGNSPGTGEFPAQMVSNAENVSIWWRHHASTGCPCLNAFFSIHQIGWSLSIYHPV